MLFCMAKPPSLLLKLWVETPLPASFLCLLLCVMTIGAIRSLIMLRANKMFKAAETLIITVVLSTSIAVPSAIILSWQQKCRDMQALVVMARERQTSPIMLGRRTPSATFYMHSKILFFARFDGVGESSER